MVKALVVEDDCDIRANIANLLELYGYNALEARNGLEALSIISKSQPDIIISDITMQGLDGFGLFSELKKNPDHASIPFIFLSAKNDVSDIKEGMGLGVDDYLTKPYDAKNLINAVKTRLEKRKNIKQKIDEIAKGISLYIPHELAIPLFPALGYLDLLISDFDDFSRDEMIEALKSIKKSCFRLKNAINKFLIYYEESMTDNRKTSVDNFILKGTAAIIDSVSRNIAKEHGRENDLETDIEEAPLKIGDDRLRILVNELIENAIKFSEKGTKIKVTGRKSSEKLYYIEVEDHGCGINQKQLCELAPFIQFNRDKFQQTGNGLGLAIVKKIIDNYEGKLFIDSKINNYTKVKVLLNSI